MIEMIESQIVKSLFDCISTIDQNLQTKEKFLASQDKVLSSLDELSVISRSIPWGYQDTLIKDAWYRINKLIFQQLLIPGVKGVDLYKIWQETSECMPIIKEEASRLANQNER